MFEILLNQNVCMYVMIVCGCIGLTGRAVMSVLTQNERFEQAQANGNKGGLKNMCEVLDRAEARGEERGISIGEARGELKGAVRAYLDVKVPIEEIAKKLNISVEEVQKIADTLYEMNIYADTHTYIFGKWSDHPLGHVPTQGR